MTVKNHAVGQVMLPAEAQASEQTCLQTYKHDLPVKHD